MEHKLAQRELAVNERMANEIMEQIGFDDIPEFLRYLHQELTNRFAEMSEDAEKENELRRRRYVAIRDAHEQSQKPAAIR